MFLLSPTSSGAMWCSTFFFFFFFFLMVKNSAFSLIFTLFWAFLTSFPFFFYWKLLSCLIVHLIIFIYLMIFFDVQVVSRWEKFLSKVKHQGGNTGNVADIQQHFPFHKFFENAPQVGTKMGNTHRYTKEIPGECGPYFQTWKLRSWFCHEIWN